MCTILFRGIIHSSEVNLSYQVITLYSLRYEKECNKKRRIYVHTDAAQAGT